MSTVTQVIIIIATFLIENEASKILAVFPTPSISHQVVFRPLILELTNRGHEVVMITTDPIFKDGQQPANLTEIDVHDLSYQTHRELLLHADITTGSKDDMQSQMQAIFTLMQKVFEKQLLTDEVQKILKDEKFDLLILEAYFPPLLALSHIFKDVPVILFSSFGSTTDNLRIVGSPNHPFVHPTFTQQRIYNLQFWEKVNELYNYLRIENTAARTEDDFHVFLKRNFDNDFPEIAELKKNVDMLFLNVHPIWEINRSVSPNVVYMGGLHQKPEKDLPQDLKKYLDSSENGVIYVSFGTNVEPSMLPPEKIQALVNTFSKLPYDVLWKWNQDKLPGRTKNIKISKWLPQSDLLKHPKVKLFITQGGQQSTDEAITAGVPLIGIPMLTDQWYNVEQYVHHKIGLHVDMDTITEPKLRKAIETILNDKSYRDNIVKLRTIMSDEPETPLQRAVWWTEYLLRHGTAKHLHSPAANVTWTEYLELQLMFYLALGFLFLLVLLSFTVNFLYGIFRKLRVSNKVKSS